MRNISLIESFTQQSIYALCVTNVYMFEVYNRLFIQLSTVEMKGCEHLSDWYVRIPQTNCGKFSGNGFVGFRAFVVQIVLLSV